MYRGFNVSLKNHNDQYYRDGLRLFNETRDITIHQLDKYVGVDGVINGADLEEDWFGEIDAHIFISHSHVDRRLAISLAGYLYKCHNLRCFIDSCVWGYSNDLLKKIDSKYCKNSDSSTYDYNARNYSTSHVHMMLSSALNKMIDKCECLFLINTPNSIQTSDILNETYSPWIYSEILTSKLIDKKEPLRHSLGALEERADTIRKAEMFSEKLIIKHRLDLDHLVELSEMDVTRWGRFQSYSPEHALDKLYGYKPAPIKKDFNTYERR
jgi:hypothetical protein